MKTLEESDVILFMVLPSADIHSDDRRIIELIGAARKPCIVAINKIDTVERVRLLPVIEAYSKAHHFEEIFPVCALTGEGNRRAGERSTATASRGAAVVPGR